MQPGVYWRTGRLSAEPGARGPRRPAKQATGRKIPAAPGPRGRRPGPPSRRRKTRVMCAGLAGSQIADLEQAPRHLRTAPRIGARCTSRRGARAAGHQTDRRPGKSYPITRTDGAGWRPRQPRLKGILTCRWQQRRSSWSARFPASEKQPDVVPDRHGGQFGGSWGHDPPAPSGARPALRAGDEPNPRAPARVVGDQGRTQRRIGRAASGILKASATRCAVRRTSTNRKRPMLAMARGGTACSPGSRGSRAADRAPLAQLSHRQAGADAQRVAEDADGGGAGGPARATAAKRRPIDLVASPEGAQTPAAATRRRCKRAY
jgi:hypothetical protein